MRDWYLKYASIYNKDIAIVPQTIINEIKEKISAKKTDIPIASVVIIAHNEAKHLLSCLWSLADNQCTFPIEILVVDNHSTDQTAHVIKSIEVQSVYEERQSPGYARQCGLDHAKGKYHLCIDADTIYPPYYIQTMIETLQRPNIIAAYALWSFLPDKQLPLWRIKIFELLRDIYLSLQNINRPELNVRGMTFAFNTNAARKYGFRTDIIRGEDGSLALNLKKEGKLYFIRSSKARPITDNSIIKKQGSIMAALWIRIKKAAHGILGLLHPQKYYKDKDDNIIHK